MNYKLNKKIDNFLKYIKYSYNFFWSILFITLGEKDINGIQQTFISLQNQLDICKSCLVPYLNSWYPFLKYLLLIISTD